MRRAPTVHGAHYYTMLCEKLTAAFRSRCSTLLSKAFYRCMTMPIHLLPSKLLKPSGNCTPDVFEHPLYRALTSFRPVHLGSPRHNKRPPICQWTKGGRIGAHSAFQSANSVHCWTIHTEKQAGYQYLKNYTPAYFLLLLHTLSILCLTLTSIKTITKKYAMYFRLFYLCQFAVNYSQRCNYWKWTWPCMTPVIKACSYGLIS